METREVFVFPPPCLSLLPAVVRGAGPSFFILLFSWSASFLLQLRSLFFLHFLLYLVVGFCFFCSGQTAPSGNCGVSFLFIYFCTPRSSRSALRSFRQRLVLAYRSFPNFMRRYNGPLMTLMATNSASGLQHPFSISFASLVYSYTLRLFLASECLLNC